MTNIQTRVSAFAFVVVLGSLLLGSSVEAQQRSQSGVAEIPVQIGVGPAGLLLAGPAFPDLGFSGILAEDRLIHTGLRLSLTAIINEEIVRKHPRLIPRQYRQRIIDAGEFRFSPGVVALIPTTLVISPPIAGSAQAYGATWSLLGAGIPLVREPVRFTVSGALIGTLLYIRSPSLEASNYLFARPGVEVRLELEVPIHQDLRVTIGAATQAYIAQSLEGTGTDMFEMGEYMDAQSLWNINQLFLQAQFRVPYNHRY